MINIIFERIKVLLNVKLRENRTGFINFINFDSIDPINAENIIVLYCIISHKLIRMIRSFYDNCTAGEEHNGDLAGPIKIEKGVRQGYVLSPTLFLVIMD